MKLSDMDQTEAWAAGAILPPGWHDVAIVSSEEGKSSGGYPQIELEYEGSAGTIREWMVVTEKSKGNVKQLLNAAGIEAQGGEWDWDPASLIGRKVGILVVEEPDYNDPTKVRSNVSAHRPPGQGANDLPVKGGEPGPAGVGAKKAEDDIPF